MSDKIIKICKSISKLTEEDFSEMQTIIEGQSSYIHPLKHTTQNKINDLADHNEIVLSKLKDVYQTIVDKYPQKKS